MTREQLEKLNEIFGELGKSLDITETQYNALAKSYQAVGSWLSENDSSLKTYTPEILPQGSFMLGTMIRPINDSDDLDIDLVCQLTGKYALWTQKDVKMAVGDRIQQHSMYKGMLQRPDGRRCWTLLYGESSDDSQRKYHMDILPCIIDNNYKIILENAFSNLSDMQSLDDLAIRITDKKLYNYTTENNPKFWLKSNPFGYAKWFFNRCSLGYVKDEKLFSINESIKPLPKYSSKKYILQRIVQILKRHRDVMFNGDNDKPISIIITTLAAYAYNGEYNLVDGLSNVVNKMEKFIRVTNGNYVISNPVNTEENFADKWVGNPKKRDNFYKWLNKVKEDVNLMCNLSNISMDVLTEFFTQMFGENIAKELFNNYALKYKDQRDSNFLSVSSIGILGKEGIKMKPHNFYGKE
ncbi:MAG: nucleotidyltransferase [Paludibacteraceae bacterium]|nr:nucleotidyltransferase [Paludibacteraceae bacterium]